jgi:DNA-binding IclR family transcriptional regulator
VQVSVVNVGHRQPLGVGAAGLAILSALDRADLEACFEDIGRKLAQQSYGRVTMPMIRRHVAEAQKAGYAVATDFAIPGITGVGVPVLDAQGRPFAAISVGSISIRMSDKRIPVVAAQMRNTAARLEQELARPVRA